MIKHVIIWAVVAFGLVGFRPWTHSRLPFTCWLLPNAPASPLFGITEGIALLAIVCIGAIATGYFLPASERPRWTQAVRDSLLLVPTLVVVGYGWLMVSSVLPHGVQEKVSLVFFNSTSLLHKATDWGPPTLQSAGNQGSFYDGWVRLIVLESIPIIVFVLIFYGIVWAVQWCRSRQQPVKSFPLIVIVGTALFLLVGEPIYEEPNTELPDVINRVTFAPNGRWILIQGITYHKVWDLNTKQIVGQLPWSQHVQVSPNSQLAAVLIQTSPAEANPAKVLVVRLPSCEVVREIQAEGAEKIWLFGFGHNSTTILSYSNRYGFQVTDIASGNVVFSKNIGPVEGISAIRSSDHRQVAFLHGENRTLYVWNDVERTLVAPQVVHPISWLLQFSDSGDRLIVDTTGPGMVVGTNIDAYDTSSWSIVPSIPNKELQLIRFRGRSISGGLTSAEWDIAQHWNIDKMKLRGATMSNDGSMLLLYASKLKLLSTQTGEMVDIAPSGCYDRDWKLTLMLVSPDNQWLAVIYQDRRLALWHLPTMHLSSSLAGIDKNL